MAFKDASVDARRCSPASPTWTSSGSFTDGRPVPDHPRHRLRAAGRRLAEPGGIRLHRRRVVGRGHLAENEAGRLRRRFRPRVLVDVSRVSTATDDGRCSGRHPARDRADVRPRAGASRSRSCSCSARGATAGVPLTLSTRLRVQFQEAAEGADGCSLQQNILRASLVVLFERGGSMPSDRGRSLLTRTSAGDESPARMPIRLSTCPASATSGCSAPRRAKWASGGRRGAGRDQPHLG